MTDRTLFDPVPDPGCRICDGRGYWTAYRHGVNPKLYPTFRCSCPVAAS